MSDIDLDDEVSNKPAKQEAALAKRRIDKEKFERADREARKLIEPNARPEMPRPPG